MIKPERSLSTFPHEVGRFPGTAELDVCWERNAPLLPEVENISKRTLNHYSLIESELYSVPRLFSGTTESPLIKRGGRVGGRTS